MLSFLLLRLLEEGCSSDKALFWPLSTCYKPKSCISIESIKSNKINSLETLLSKDELRSYPCNYLKYSQFTCSVDSVAAEFFWIWKFDFRAAIFSASALSGSTLSACVFTLSPSAPILTSALAAFLLLPFALLVLPFSLGLDLFALLLNFIICTR